MIRSIRLALTFGIIIMCIWLLSGAFIIICACAVLAADYWEATYPPREKQEQQDWSCLWE